MAKVETKITFDMREFNDFSKKAPGIMDGLVKQSFERGAAKIRKEFIKTIDRGSWAELQETPQYRSKYGKPLQMLKRMVRYRVTGGKKRVKATVGIFPGKVRNDRMGNAEFKSKYGVTVARFGKLMTYGGRLRVSSRDRKLFASRGFYLSRRTNTIKFPKRDWYNPTRWKEPSMIIPYINKDLNERVMRRFK